MSSVIANGLDVHGAPAGVPPLPFLPIAPPLLGGERENSLAASGQGKYYTPPEVVNPAQGTGSFLASAAPAAPVAPVAPVEKPENHKRPWTASHILFLLAETADGRSADEIAEALRRNGQGARDKLRRLLDGQEEIPAGGQGHVAAIRAAMEKTAMEKAAMEKAASKKSTVEKTAEADRLAVSPAVLIEEYRHLSHQVAMMLTRLNQVIERQDYQLAAAMVLAQRLRPSEINPVGRMLAGIMANAHLARIVALANGVRSHE